MVAIKAKTLNEVLHCIDHRDTLIFAGGTDLMVKYKNWSGLVPTINKDVIFIDDIDELKHIDEDETSIEIGSCCSLSDILKNKNVPYVLREAADNMASVAVRNLATIGGNICNSSPAGDLLPPLYGLDAKIKIESKNHERILPINQFILGPGKNLLHKNEILTKVIIKKEIFQKEIYKKVGTRKSTALSKLSFVGLCKSNNSGIEDIRIAFGAVGPKVVYSKSIEEEIIMKGLLNKKDIENIINKYRSLISPITDQRSTESYRKTVCLNLLEDFLKSV